MKVALPRLLALVACFQLVGGHWLAMQTIAWATMFSANQQGGSVVEAFEKTFDGDHPCHMCKAIAKGMEEEDSDQPSRTSIEWSAVLVKRVILPTRSAAPSFSLEFLGRELERIESILDPPPWLV